MDPMGGTPSKRIPSRCYRSQRWLRETLEAMQSNMNTSCFKCILRIGAFSDIIVQTKLRVGGRWVTADQMDFICKVLF